MRTDGLIERRPANAAVSWFFLAVLLVVGAVNLWRGDLLWAGLTAAIALVALVPPALARDASVIASWEALSLAALPVAVHVAGVFREPVTYVAVATLALLVVVQITEFSRAEAPGWFAVSFVVMTTMSVAAVWGVVQFYADRLLGTALLAGREDLMWDLVGATVVGLGAGLLFELYFRRQSGPDDRPAVGEG